MKNRIFKQVLEKGSRTYDGEKISFPLEIQQSRPRLYGKIRHSTYVLRHQHIVKIVLHSL